MVASKKIRKPTGKVKANKKLKNKGFEKAWAFWKNAHVDLSQFKFNREEANAH